MSLAIRNRVGPSLAGHREKTAPFAPMLMKAAGSPTNSFAMWQFRRSGQYKPVFDRRFSMLEVKFYDAQANTDREIGAFLNTCVAIQARRGSMWNGVQVCTSICPVHHDISSAGEHGDVGTAE